jgi:hypothetical protein
MVSGVECKVQDMAREQRVMGLAARPTVLLCSSHALATVSFCRRVAMCASAVECYKRCACGCPPGSKHRVEGGFDWKERWSGGGSLCAEGALEKLAQPEGDGAGATQVVCVQGRSRGRSTCPLQWPSGWQCEAYGHDSTEAGACTEAS